MKLYIAMVTVAALVAPTATLAYDIIFDTPKYYDEFVGKYKEKPEPVTKLEFSSNIQNEQKTDKTQVPREDK